MTVAFVLGLRIGDINTPYRKFLELRQQVRDTTTSVSQMTPEQAELESQRRAQLAKLDAIRPRAALHMTLATLAALITLLVHSVGITYFIGTAKWCGEVVGAYDLDRTLYEESRRLKRRCFPWSLLGISALIFTVALGAASDPATLAASTWKWAEPHLWSAIGLVAISLISFWKQFQYLSQNVDVIERVQQQVQAVRARHGLD